MLDTSDNSTQALLRAKRATTALMLHCVPAFVAAAPLRVGVAPRRLCARRVAMTLGSGEEELFIRRAAERAAAKVAPPPPPAPREEEGEFFVSQSDGGLAAAEGGGLAAAEVGDGGEDGAVKGTVKGESKRSEGEAAEPVQGVERPLRVLSMQRVRGVSGKVRKEAVRLVTESSLGTYVRIPTRREAVLVAWEVVLVVALLSLLRAGVSRTLRWIHHRLNDTRGLKSNIPYEQSVFECMQRPLEFLSIFTVGTAVAEAVSRPLAATGLLRYIRTLRELGIIISATWFLLRWIDRIRSRFAVDKRIDKAQVDATSRIATVATTAISLLISLDTVGINVQTVLAFGGIGGVAIGFAGREIISNFFGGFMIYVTRPFTVGEWIRSIEEAELNGTVEDIGWYLTRVRTWDKRPLYIPNSRFSTLIVENGSRMDNRRILHTIDLRHEDIPVVPKIIAAMDVVLMNHPELDPKQHRMVYVDSFGSFSVRIWLSCYTKSVFLYDYRRVQQEVLLKAYEIIRANGARLATSNTRDIRPGVNPDRYGPLGNAASFGSVSGAIAKENAAAAAAAAARPFVNSDVPGAPNYAQIHRRDGFQTIESGIQPTPPASAPISTPAQAATSGSNTEKESEASLGQNGTPVPRTASESAVAAAAAAFAAARRNAARIEDESVKASATEFSDVSAETQDIVEDSTVTTAAAAQMKISAAPPARNAGTGTSTGTGATASAGSAVGMGGPTSVPGSGVTGPNLGDGVDARIVGNVPAASSAEDAGAHSTQSSDKVAAAAPAGHMKISAVPSMRPISSGTAHSASGGGTGSDGPGAANTTSSSGSGPAGGTVLGESASTDEPVSNVDEAPPAGSGVMKISKARKPKPMAPDTVDGSSSSSPQGPQSPSNSSAFPSTTKGLGNESDVV